ncbi:MAG: HNH endonuclease [Chloroflexi bacterium]|nr:HNH endonuclease [Chloroflexota bacterium]
MSKDKLTMITGSFLNTFWGIGAEHALYHKDGNWYHQLKKFPGVLFDAHGYILFETNEEFFNSPFLRIRKDVRVPQGILSIPQYIKLSKNLPIETISRIKVNNKPAGNRLTRRTINTIDRIQRDTKVSSWVKYVYNYACQICGIRLQIGQDKFYAECHHIRPLGGVHQGEDIVENVLCVCPNHHALLDYGAIRIDFSTLRSHPNHLIDPESIDYHNNNLFNTQIT